MIQPTIKQVGKSMKELANRIHKPEYRGLRLDNGEFIISDSKMVGSNGAKYLLDQDEMKWIAIADDSLCKWTGYWDRDFTPIFEWDILASEYGGDDTTDTWTEEEAGYTMIRWGIVRCGFIGTRWFPEVGGSNSIYDLQYVYVVSNVWENNNRYKV